MGPQDAHPMTPQDTLSSYLNGSAAAVRRTFVHVENSYILPIVDLLGALLSAYPIPFVFFSIFITLSFFPVLAFITVSIATLSAALTFALCLACLFSTGVVLFLGGILLSTLGFALLLSGFLTTFLISAYLSGRLVLILRRSGRSGLRIWSQEVSHMFFPSSAHRVLAEDDQYGGSEDPENVIAKGMKEGPAIKIEPMRGEPPDSELKLVT